VDLIGLLGMVAGWIFWLAGVAAVGSAGASMLYLALGDRDRAVKLFKGSMAAILVAAFGQAILLAVIGTLGGWSAWSAQAGQVTRYPEAGTAIYIVAFILLLLASINLARGRVEEGGWMIVGSVLALALVVFAAQAFGNTVMQYGGGPLLVEARTDRAVYEPGQQVFLYVTVRASGLAVSTADLTVEWGDGTVTRKTGVPVGREVVVCYEEGIDFIGRPYCKGKTYSLGREEEVGFFTIGIEATARAGGSQLTGVNYVSIYVRKLPGLIFPFSGLGGFLSLLLNLMSLGMLDPTRLFYAPVFRFDGPEGGWYRMVLTASVTLMPVFLLFRIAPGLAYNPGAAIVEGFRDAAFAVLAMILVPHAYNVTAGVLNTFTEMIMGSAGAAIVSQMAGTAVALASIYLLVSLVAPGVGFLGSLILLTVLIINAIALLRWFLLLALVATSPFLILAWLHPYLRGAVDTFKGLAGAMLVAGPVAAAFTLLFTKVVLGDNPVQQLLGSAFLSWLGIFVVGLLPQLVTGLAVTGLGSTLSYKLESAVREGAPQVSKAIATAGTRGLAAGATVAGAAAYARAMRVKPIADAMRAGGAMIGKARETLSRAATNLQSRLEGRVARDETRFTGATARLGALTSLKKSYEEHAELSQRAGDAYNRLYHALQYYDELSPEEQQDPEKMLPLALSRMEYDTLAEARAQKEEQIEEMLGEYYEKNLIKSDERRNLKNLAKAPQLAIGTLNKMIEEQQHETQIRKAELERDRVMHGRFAKAVEKFRGAPARLRKLVSEFFTIPREGEEEYPSIRVKRKRST
jgi:hypothetical protein